MKASRAACERARKWVSLELDLELSELEASLLRAHLGRCTECAAHAAGVRSFTRELRAAAVELPGRPVSVERPRAARPRAIRIAAAAAVLVAAVALGGLAGRVASPGSSTAARGAVSAAQAEFEPRLLAFAGLQASATESGKAIAV